jgi:hypothetical protein
MRCIDKILTYDLFYSQIVITISINEIASLITRWNNTNLLPTHAKIKDTPSYSLGSRPADAKIYVTPAPGAYESCDTNQYKGKSPAFSLRTRYVIPSDVAMKPGPGAYTPEKTDTKTAPPQYSFGTRHSKYMYGARPLPGEETRPLPY